jgi:hypothetical protein
MATSFSNLLQVNETQLAHWKLTGYSVEDIHRVFRGLDDTYMFAILSFNDSSDIQMRVSKCTWERQEGHYPAIAKYFTVLAHHPIMHGANGHVAVWLEDGLWEFNHAVARQIPVFAFGRGIQDYHTLLMPDPAFIAAQGYVTEMEDMQPVAEQYPWSERANTIFWRGAASGLGMEGNGWQTSARAQLALRAKELNQPDLLDAKFTRLSHLSEERQHEIVTLGLTDDELPFENFYRYKYLVDVDGYCCAWRSLFLKLATGSVVLKINSPYMQWFYPELKPWKHYIPISSDLKEIEDIHRWLLSHDKEAEEIAYEGKAFAQSVEYYASIEGMARTCRALLDTERR